MANFSTHVNVAAVVSASAAGFLATHHIMDTKTAFLCFSAGIIGGVLPDIDHDNSIPVKIIQFIISNIIAFIVIYKFINSLKFLEIIILWFGVYLINEFIFYFFKKLTTHRGIIHSIPAAFLFWCGSTFILYRYLDFSLKKSYLIGGFVFVGFITHLILDEMFSVDLAGRKIKKSFGSAFKVCSKNTKVNLFIYSLLFICFICMPQKEILINMIKGIINV